MEVLRAFLVDFAGNTNENRKTPPQLVESSSDELLKQNDIDDDERSAKRARLDNNGAYFLVPHGGGKGKPSIKQPPTNQNSSPSSAQQPHHTASTPAPMHLSAPYPLMNHNSTAVHNPMAPQTSSQVMVQPSFHPVSNAAAPDSQNPIQAPVMAHPMTTAPMHLPPSVPNPAAVELPQQLPQQLPNLQSGGFPNQPTTMMPPAPPLANTATVITHQNLPIATYALPTQQQLSLTAKFAADTEEQQNLIKQNTSTSSKNDVATMALPAPQQLSAAAFPHSQIPVPVVPLSLHSGFENYNATTNMVDTDALRKREKRKRNAEQAKKTRERKKQASNFLGLEYLSLKRENEHLKSLVHRNLPDQAQEIIGECCYKSKANGAFHGQHSAQLRGSDFELIENLTKTRQSFCLTDPRRKDNPIVYASCAFLQLTGYKREDIIGENCRFLQGEKTDKEAVHTIKTAIANGTDATTCILNYKRDGTPFWNHFFIAPLRDKQLRVVNYVGIQTEIPAPDQIKKDEAGNEANNTLSTTSQHNMSLTERLKALEEGRKEKIVSPVPQPLPQDKEQQEKNQFEQSLPVEGQQNQQDDFDVLDWAELAETLEGEFPVDPEFEIIKFDADEDLDSLLAEHNINTASCNEQEDDIIEQANYEHFARHPRELIQRTIRSEVVNSIMKANGDTSDPHFLSAIELLSKLFKQDAIEADINTSKHSVMHGHWRSISRPPYHSGGCKGQNENGDFVYTLGKTSFNMFKPSDLRTTIQCTMNKIEPTVANNTYIAPWSLRRELAYGEDISGNSTTDQQQSSDDKKTMLKSYNISAALTIEPPGPFQEEGADPTTFPSPPCRLRATYKVQGYFLPDPEVANRLTVWFTGGQLSPAAPPESASGNDEEEQLYGGLEQWMELFGAEHRRSWGEALSLMGAKLFLGAELPDGMEPDGTMSYSLHRPYGGHGKGYVDVMYADHELLITKGNSGTLHVMISNN